MEQTLAAPAHEVPEAADLGFEDLYRSSRDDVFAYAAGLLRDRSAAEDVTATAFERAFRKVSARFNPRLFVPGATASHARGPEPEAIRAHSWRPRQVNGHQVPK